MTGPERDPAVLAALPEVQALIAAAAEVAAVVASGEERIWEAMCAIRNLIHAEATAILARAAEIEKEGGA